MSTDARRSEPTVGVVIPAPILGLIALALGFGAEWFAPLGLLAQVSAPVRYWLCVALIGIALILLVLSVRGFRRARTTLRALRPTTRLVTTGIYAHMRNPIYVAFTLVLLGVAVASAADSVMLGAVLFALVVHYGIVRREEVYLEGKFGDEYRSYKARVPRYGWRF